MYSSYRRATFISNQICEVEQFTPSFTLTFLVGLYILNRLTPGNTQDPLPPVTVGSKCDAGILTLWVFSAKPALSLVPPARPRISSTASWKRRLKAPNDPFAWRKVALCLGVGKRFSIRFSTQGREEVLEKRLPCQSSNYGRN